MSFIATRCSSLSRPLVPLVHLPTALESGPWSGQRPAAPLSQCVAPVPSAQLSLSISSLSTLPYPMVSHRTGLAKVIVSYPRIPPPPIVAEELPNAFAPFLGCVIFLVYYPLSSSALSILSLCVSGYHLQDLPQGLYSLFLMPLFLMPFCPHSA